MPQVSPDLDKTIEFLELWKPGGPWVLTAVAPNKQGIDTATFTEHAKVRAWVEAQGGKRRNVYFHVNTTMGPLTRKAAKVDVRSMDWIHVDLDPEPGKPIDEEKRRILELLQRKHAMVPPPTMILHSGGGYWGFWRLEQPIQINGDEKKAEDAERYNLQLELMFDADACHNVDRIARLPGTINYPNEKKRRAGQQECVAEVVMHEPGRAYPLSEFMQAPEVDGSIADDGQNAVPVSTPTGNVRRINKFDLDGELPPGVTTRCKAAIVQGSDEEQPLQGDNSASAWLWYVVNELVRNEVDDEVIYAIITDPDLGISEHVRKQGNSKAQHRAAVRAIRRAKERAIDPRLEELNAAHAAVMSVGGKFRIVHEHYDHAMERDDVEFLLPDGFRLTYCNKQVEIPVQGPTGTSIKLVPLGKWWLEHPHRRTYKSVLFYPNQEFPDHLNLWRGYGCDAIPGDCSLFLDHTRDVLCKGNEEHYRFMVGWMANAVQNPHLPGHTAIVMRGGQGTGKGTFAKHFGRLFGAHYKYVSNPEHVTGQFNILLQTAVVVFADECFAAGPKHTSALKALITEPQLRVEAKGLDNLDVRNCVHLIMATNKEWAVEAELDDRRFFVIDVDRDRASDTDYFAAITAQMEAGGYEALLHFLLNYDLSEFNPYKCPKTAELRRQQERSMNWIERGWLHCLEEGKLMEDHAQWKRKVTKSELTAALMATGEPRQGMSACKQALGDWLLKHAGAQTHRLTGSNTYRDHRGNMREEKRPRAWGFPSLEECRRMWDRAFGEREWPPIDDAPEVPEEEGPF